MCMEHAVVKGNTLICDLQNENRLKESRARGIEADCALPSVVSCDIARRPASTRLKGLHGEHGTAAMSWNGRSKGSRMCVRVQ